MTVAELITELQRQPPHKRVHVCISEVYGIQAKGDGTYFDNGDGLLLLDPAFDSIEAHYVRDEGAYVLIESR